VRRVWILALIALAAGTAPLHGQAFDVPDARRDERSDDRDRGMPGLAESDVERGLQADPWRDALAGPIDAQRYRVGPGDVLRFHMWGRVSRSVSLVVSPEGMLFLPGAGTLPAAGKTLAEVRASVLTAMGREFRGVGMDLRLAIPRAFRVYLTGQVKTPGPVRASGVDRVADVVRRSGLLDDASERHIEILRQDGSREISDLVLFLATGDASLNPPVSDGDVIQVPVRKEFVYANGAVARPGRFELGTKDSLHTLLRLAGGPMPAAADNRVLLMRWVSPFQAESAWVSLAEIEERRVNPKLQEGDRFYVYFVPQYHQQHEATILGEISRPGVFPIAEGRDRLSHIVAAAGGFLPTADLTAVAILRRNNVSAEDPELQRMMRQARSDMTTSEYANLRTRLASLREEYRVDWNRLKENDESLDLLLRDGDIVRVERLVSSIRVDGEVKNPGILAYQPGSNVDEYIEQAGGFTNRAWTRNVRVTRAVTGQTLPAKNTPTLGPGDFVWVPEKRDVSFWDVTGPFLTAAAQIAAVVIAVNSLK